MAEALYGNVYFREAFAGTLREEPDGRYTFTYDPAYAGSGNPGVAHTLPLQHGPIYSTGGLHSYFDNLVAEGWLANAQMRALGLQPHNRFAGLLAFGHDCIGAVSVLDPRARKQPDLHTGTAEEIAALASRASISGVQPKMLAVQTAAGYRPAGTRSQHPYRQVAFGPTPRHRRARVPHHQGRGGVVTGGPHRDARNCRGVRREEALSPGAPFRPHIGWRQDPFRGVQSTARPPLRGQVRRLLCRDGRFHARQPSVRSRGHRLPVPQGPGQHPPRQQRCASQEFRAPVRGPCHAPFARVRFRGRGAISRVQFGAGSAARRRPKSQKAGRSYRETRRGPGQVVRSRQGRASAGGARPRPAPGRRRTSGVRCAPWHYAAENGSNPTHEETMERDTQTDRQIDWAEIVKEAHRRRKAQG